MTALVGTRHTAVGLYIVRTADTLLQVHFPPPARVQHWPKYFGDVRLWHRGEWVIDHPKGYGADERSHNCPLMAGMGRMLESTTLQLSGRTSGVRYDAKQHWAPPPAFADMRRHVFDHALPNVKVIDVLEGVQPERASDYLEPDKSLIPLAPGLLTQLWHAPVEPEGTGSGFTWVTPGGQRVTLTTDAPHRRTYQHVNGQTMNGNFHESQLGWWRIDFARPDAGTITTTVTIGEPAPPPVPPEPPAVPQAFDLSRATATIENGQLVVRIPGRV